ncbi:ribosome biogenesis GTP-binding protein YihA/YsxC [Thiobacter aerophilum]|uniref:Probable GTP-binding protein EngB n=1 Tax=Thiobacter aerophilum TaxID=3121275 RepID=A0ABV0ED64_9BURK
MALFSRLQYEKSVHDLSELPTSRQEIAFAGRSNAGKSSAINTLAGRKTAFVSKIPGRTQLINFFRIEEGQYLVDLPGYGYARVPEAVRRHWQATLARYLETRASLVGLVLIMDARHPLTPLDRQMIAWFAPSGRPIHCLLTKADKLSRGQATRTLHKVWQELAAQGPAFSVQLFSSLKKQGVAEAEAVLAGWLGREQAQAAPGGRA